MFNFLTTVVLYWMIVGSSHEMSWIDYLSRLSVVAFLLISHYGFYKEWWVWGPTHSDLLKRYDIRGLKIEKLEQEKDAWKEQALTGQRVAERSTTIAEAAMRRGQQQQDRG